MPPGPTNDSLWRSSLGFPDSCNKGLFFYEKTFSLGLSPTGSFDFSDKIENGHNRPGSVLWHQKRRLQKHSSETVEDGQGGPPLLPTTRCRLRPLWKCVQVREWSE